MGYFKGKQFKKDIILVAVGYYCRFSLSYRDVSELLKERGISVHPTTIMRWVHEYGDLIYQIWKKKNKSAHFAWHLDETYIKVKGEWCYLYRAIDREGYTLDIQLRKTRGHQAAYMFMKRLVKTFGEPTVLTTDKAPALLCAFKKLKNNDFYVHTKHCTVKHFNNPIEQDIDMSNDVLPDPQDFKISVMLHVQSKESKPFTPYINEDEVFKETPSFQHTRNYNNY